MTEEWRKAPGYEGYFEVSSLGGIRSVERVITVSGRNNHSRFSCKKTVGGRIMNPVINSEGYRQTTLGRKSILIHRLVAAAFIQTDDGKPFVNHKNGVRADNRVSNLEWCTNSENLRHAYRELGVINPLKGRCSSLHPRSKPVTAISLKTGVIFAFDCALDAIRTGIGKDSGGISRSCAGKIAHHNGFVWTLA